MMDIVAGPVAQAERELLVFAAQLMLIAVIPVIGLSIWYIWRFRANSGAPYRPDWDESRGLDIVVWAIPAVMIMIIGSLVWTSTHRLDPYLPLKADKPALTVQAVAQDWKWLFIYPEQGVATVNEMAFPADRPLNIEITSEVAMNSFMIPQLGGQIYAMGGMMSRLNLQADRVGTFEGRNMLYSGDGFSQQTFLAHALSDEDFTAWVTKVKAAPNALDEAAYAKLQEPSTAHPVEYYNAVIPDLFQSIITRLSSHTHEHHEATK